VVIPLTTSAWLMLQRNLLYTAVTRAKRLVVLVGSRRVGQGGPDPGRWATLRHRCRLPTKTSLRDEIVANSGMDASCSPPQGSSAPTMGWCW
jgi:ATP-dependent exoDNAse (exonuclease V) beta subunit